METDFAGRATACGAVLKKNFLEFLIKERPDVFVPARRYYLGHRTKSGRGYLTYGMAPRGRAIQILWLHRSRRKVSADEIMRLIMKAACRPSGSGRFYLVNVYVPVKARFITWRIAWKWDWSLWHISGAGEKKSDDFCGNLDIKRTARE